MSDLTQKKCVACEGGIPPLSRETVEKMMQQVPGWVLDDSNKFLQIEREFKFNDFKETLKFVNNVGELAEAEGHHPNIYLHSWNKVRLELYTHAINGLHENDFIVAAKINMI
jgi:4a-hydroxytetrahydrobiopterin dehydratase